METTLQLGLAALSQIGFSLKEEENGWQMSYHPGEKQSQVNLIYTFLSAVQEEQFRRQYFAQISLETLERSRS
jgi:single-stranded-DNA-specific exonuclease